MRILLCLAFVCAHAATVAAAPVSPDQDEQLKSGIAGEYRLESGRSVRLSLVGESLYIELNNVDRRELHPVGPNLLASNDGALTVQYLPEGPTERIHIRHERFPAGHPIGIVRMVGR
jgi:hypothetical protein